METQPIAVLHLDDVKGWRGGQQQAMYLFRSMVDKKYRTAIACQPDSAYERRAGENQLPCHTLKMRGELDVPAGWKIARLCRKHGYSIIHAHSAHALTLGLWAKLFNRRLILIASRRVDFSIQKNRFSLCKYKNPFLDKVICISDNIRQVLLKDGLPEVKLVTIHSGIDVHKFAHLQPDPGFRKRWQIPEDHGIIGTVAAMVGHKDYPNLLRAARRVIDANTKVTFMAVGSGRDKDSIRALAKRLGLKQRFIFCGFQKDVGPFLKHFDIFVLASKMEGLGTSILDAQAVGLPVVGTRAGGIPEAVRHEDNGLLVPPRDPAALAGALLDLLNDPEKRRKLGTRALQTVSRFDISNTVEATIKLYHNLLRLHQKHHLTTMDTSPESDGS